MVTHDDSSPHKKVDVPPAQDAHIQGLGGGKVHPQKEGFLHHLLHPNHAPEEEKRKAGEKVSMRAKFGMVLPNRDVPGALMPKPEVEEALVPAETAGDVASEHSEQLENASVHSSDSGKKSNRSSSSKHKDGHGEKHHNLRKNFGWD